MVATSSSSPTCCFCRKPIVEMPIVLSLFLVPCTICRSDLGMPKVYARMSTSARNMNQSTSFQRALTSLNTSITALFDLPSWGWAATQSWTASSVTSVTPSRILLAPGRTWHLSSSVSVEDFLTISIALRVAMLTTSGSLGFPV